MTKYLIMLGYCLFVSTAYRLDIEHEIKSAKSIAYRIFEIDILNQKELDLIERYYQNTRILDREL